MNEELLHYMWQHRLFLPNDLLTTSNESFEIIDPGVPNNNAGPDFFNAKIKFGETLLAGNVEIHLEEEDWNRHKHHQDPAYNNVILHVVKKAGQGIFTADRRLVPTWELKSSKQMIEKYEGLYSQKDWIACEEHIKKVDSFVIMQWLDRLLIERFQEKQELIDDLLIHCNRDWDQVFFILLARSFGFGVNSQPFEMMAKQTPLKVLLKHSSDLLQLEALLFGQAGLLQIDELNDGYSQLLWKEYQFLSAKYKLRAIDGYLWKYLRLRPINFPTIRMAQLASVIFQTKGVFDVFLDEMSYVKMSDLFTVSLSDYWKNHYKLGVCSKKESHKELGKRSRELLVMNTIIPYLFVFFDKRNDFEGKERVLEMLYEMPSEQNNLITKWKSLGVRCRSGGESQALIFLKNNYCDHKKCLNCHIGHKVLSST